MLNITITEQTPDNMLRAIRAACNELLGETTAERQILNEVVLNLKNDEQAAHHVAANSNQDRAAAGPSTLTISPELQALAAGQDAIKAEDADRFDSTGAEWNPELHASTKAKNQDGTWKKRRGAGKADEPTPMQLPEGYGQVSHVPVAIENATPAQVAAALPPLPPPAPATPLVTMNDIYALITNGKAVLNDVIAAAQAMGFADVGAFSRDATPEQRAQLLQELTA